MLSNRPDITTAVYRGRKPSKQQPICCQTTEREREREREGERECVWGGEREVLIKTDAD